MFQAATATHRRSGASELTAVTMGKENGQNKPPKLNYLHFARRVKLGRLILPVLFPLCHCGAFRSATSSVCVPGNNANSIAKKLRDLAVQRSCYLFVCLSAPCQKYFHIERTLFDSYFLTFVCLRWGCRRVCQKHFLLKKNKHKNISRDGSRKLFVGCYANVLYCLRVVSAIAGRSLFTSPSKTGKQACHNQRKKIKGKTTNA